MEEPTTNEERVAFLTETYNISNSCAKALLLSEIGLSNSGIAKALGVTQSTARKYLRTLEDRIGENVTEAVPKSVRYATYPNDVPKSEVRYSGNYVDISDELEDRDVSLNRGCDFTDIPNELINI